MRQFSASRKRHKQPQGLKLALGQFAMTSALAAPWPRSLPPRNRFMVKYCKCPQLALGQRLLTQSWNIPDGPVRSWVFASDLKYSGN
ncbi:unnamed protein product [Gongylonema pulchrum]|uniref:Secreted protein n=1 Tax=Gongylonema pulchrum TaxID=637853 RepID=A0A183EG45_9BILA|nr:unnamed protein product [Gongylonema pulchrum]